MKFVVAPAKQSDMPTMLEMLARNYPPDYHTARNRGAALLKYEPSAKLNNFFVARGSDGRTLGAIRLLDRNLSLRGVSVRAIVLAHFITQPEAAGKGVARSLLEYAEKQARKRGHDVLLCWGRRKIDGMMHRFGLWGVSNYQATTITPPPATRVSFRFLDTKGVEKLSARLLALYSRTYASMPFYYRRTSVDFRYLARVRMVHSGMRVIVTGGALPSGYAVLDGDRVHEAAGDPQVIAAAFGVLATEGKSATTTLGLAHPFLKGLRDRDYTWMQRRTWKGGHVAKILDPGRFLNRLAPAIGRDLKQLQVGASVFHVGKYKATWNGTRIRFQASTDGAGPDALRVSEEMWAPLLLGTFDAPAVAPEIARTRRAESVLRLLFPACHPYFGPTEEC